MLNRIDIVTLYSLKVLKLHKENTMTHRSIGKEIAKKRKSLGLTQIVFASQINITLDALKKLEHGGKKISSALLTRIEKVLGPLEIDERIAS